MLCCFIVLLLLLLLLPAGCRFKKMQTLVLAIIAGTLFLRGTIPTDTLQGGTLFLGLIFFS